MLWKILELVVTIFKEKVFAILDKLDEFVF